jgi:hypothetical protein
MIDKAIATLAKSPDPSANIKDEVTRAQQVSGGIDKFKKDKGINLKNGGNVNMDYAKKERKQQAFEDREKKSREKGKLKAQKLKRGLKKITQKQKDITDQIIGGAKEMFGFKKGGVVCRGQGMAKNKKITKMY